MSMTRKSWELIAVTMRACRPNPIPRNQAAEDQHDKDCWALAAALKQEADKQGQKFDPVRFVTEAGVKV